MIKPWARAVITLWVFVTIPMMALMLVALVTAVPRVVGSAGAVISEDAAAVGRAWEDGGGVDLVAHVLQVLGVVLPIVAGAMILTRVGVRFFGGLTRWSQGSLSRRAVALVVSVAVVTTLTWAWWPHPGTYRPIEPDEQGLFTSIVPGSPAEPASAARPATGVSIQQAGTAAQERLGGEEPLVAAFQEGEPLPTKKHPVLAMVLVPTGDAGVEESPGTRQPGTGQPGTLEPGAEEPVTEEPTDPEPWVFPFDKPLPPAEGDNQALAVNTTDSSVTYDVAFALVWAEGDEVLNVNEAHAYASCSDCVAVAVAFQVVLIMDGAHVVVPQNLAVAANYDCYRCITAALASQLVLSVEEEPGEEELRALGAVWGKLLELARTITSYSLTEIAAQLESFKAEIVAILGEAPPVSAQASTSPTPSPSPAGPSDDDVSDSTTPSPASTPSPTTAPPTTAPPTTPPPSPTPTQPAAPSPSPSTSSTPSPSSPSATPADEGSSSAPATSPESASTPAGGTTP